MISINELVDIIADTFFNGNISVAGLVLYMLIMGAVFGFTRNVFQTLVIAVPLTFLFSPGGLGLLPTDIVLILSVILVLGLALSSKKALNRS